MIDDTSISMRRGFSQRQVLPLSPLPYLVEPIHDGSDLDACPKNWTEAVQCQDRKTYVHKMRVPGRSHPPVSLLRGCGAFLWGRYRCRGELGGSVFFAGKITHVKSLRRHNDHRSEIRVVLRTLTSVLPTIVSP